MSLVPYQWYQLRPGRSWRSLSPYLLMLIYCLLAAVLVWGVERNYSKRWLDLAPGPKYISFQPSELGKWVMIIFWLPIWIGLPMISGSIGSVLCSSMPCGRAGGGVDHQGGFRHGGVCGGDGVYDAWLGGGGVVAFPDAASYCGFRVLAAILSSETRMNRIKSFMDVEAISYQARQSLIAIGTGGLWGKGLAEVC